MMQQKFPKIPATNTISTTTNTSGNNPSANSNVNSNTSVNSNTTNIPPTASVIFSNGNSSIATNLDTNTTANGAIVSVNPATINTDNTTFDTLDYILDLTTDNFNYEVLKD